MARTKRAPAQREESSEFFDKKTGSWQGGDGDGDGEGAELARRQDRDDGAGGEAGVVQLVISVVGIYAS
ncbi:hypothetical protein E4U60_005415, partial [Claviceps pazoutovae]